MSRHTVLLLVSFVVFISLGFIPLNKPRIVGVWKVVLVETVKPDGTITFITPVESNVIFTKNFYSFCWTSNSSTTRTWQIPDSLKLARSNQSVINSGTYNLKNSILTTKASFALNPMFVDGQATFRCTFSKDTLILSGINVLSSDGIQNPVYASGAHFVSKLIKVGSID